MDRNASAPVQSLPYDNILNFIDVGTVVLDRRNKIVAFCNKAATDILQAIEVDSQFSSLTKLFGLSGKVAALVHSAAPHTIRCGQRLIGYSVHQIANESCCVFFQDVTEKKRLESIAEAVNTMDNLGYIFSGIRHEIGNPVNSIKMTMSVLKRNLAQFSPDTVEEYVDRSLAEIARVEYLLKSLKNFSLFEDIENRAFDLRPFLQQFMFLASGDFARFGIRIHSRIPPVELWVRADPRALQQVLLNLLANAKGALAESKNPEILLSVEGGEGLVLIGVEDNGCGMSEQEQQHLFKPFYTTKADGTGLGLVITRKMLAHMKSSIEISSEQQVGTRVTLSLPAVHPPEAGGQRIEE